MSEARAATLENRTEEPAVASIQSPSSWAIARIDQVCDKPQYGWTTKAVDKGSIQLLRTTDISSGRVNWLTVPYCETNPDDPAKYYLQSGDIVVSRAGSVGKSFIIKDPNTAVFASYLVRLRPRITPQYLHYFMQSQRYWAQISDKTSGIAVPNVNASKLASITLPIAPLAEQKRIVSKIGELFSDIEAGERALKRARAALARYRKSVLKAAVTGALTADWRAANKDRLEPADKLLTRILAARREAWEKAERAKLQAQGKSLAATALRGENNEFVPSPILDNLTAPTEWAWIRAEYVTHCITKGTTPKANKMSADVGEVPYIKVYNLGFGGRVDFSINPTFVDRETHESFLARSKLYPGDVLLNIVGPPLGQAAIVSDAYPEWNTNQAIALFRPVSGLLSAYLVQVLLSDQTLGWCKARAKATVGQINLTLEICRGIPIPLPSEIEQLEIVSRLSEAFSKADHVEAALDEQERAARALKQSILKAAFEGRLVRQDPNDEPAAKLLERIKASARFAKDGQAAPIAKAKRRKLS